MIIRLLAIGESLVDVVDAPDHDGSPILVEHPGGSPMNIAVGAARLDVPATLLTAVGPDARGQAIVEHVEASGVTVDPLSFRDEPTSSATAHIQTDGSADYSFDLRWSLPDGLPAPTSGIVHTGSLGAFVEPGGSAVVELLRAIGPEVLITFDPNIRPALVGEHPDAYARFAEIAAFAAVLKLSDEDAAWLYPGLGLDEVIDRILDLGPALVAVTRGGEGALLATRRDRVAVAGVRVDVIDTIGAGDSFMSALIAQLAGLLEAGATPHEVRTASVIDADALERIGAFAVRCAAITVSRAGANPPHLSDVD
ncbi:carbohydrate kinase family protein [Herbiconiux sp. YIM B11900]|uniref:carbohydrate kinase family protein n=1 Tax=Herbiconiux sp. YIM B11900 TaxID=3404131 RepID=UPI003F84B0CD